MITINIKKFVDSNSCISDERDVSGIRDISKLGRELSKNYHHIIVESNNGWEEYERGELVGWSYPNGCGMIKINS